MHLASCDHDPPAALVPVLSERPPAASRSATCSPTPATPTASPRPGAPDPSARRQPDPGPAPQRPRPERHPPRRDLRNGNLNCPATPNTLLDIQPLARGASAEQATAHDTLCGELARYKLSPITSHDRDGYHRVICPAAQGKIRCPHRPASLTLPHDRPTILEAPEHPPACCSQQTITVPPSVNAKTAQKHDYPSPAHRNSYTAAPEPSVGLEPTTPSLP